MHTTTRPRALATRLAAAAALAFGLGLAACSAPPASTDASRTITVSATGKVSVTPDIARITVAIVSEGEDAVSAQKANVKPTKDVIARIKELGVDDSKIQTTYTDLSPIWNDEETRTYQMRTVLTVDGLDVEDAAAVMEACVDAGATEVNGPEYYVSSYDDAYAEALTKAVEASEPKAQVIADASGVTLGDVTSVTEGYQDTSISYEKQALASAEGITADEAMPNLQPGELDVTAEVTVTYAIR